MSITDNSHHTLSAKVVKNSVSTLAKSGTNILGIRLAHVAPIVTADHIF